MDNPLQDTKDDLSWPDEENGGSTAMVTNGQQDNDSWSHGSSAPNGDQDDQNLPITEEENNDNLTENKELQGWIDNLMGTGNAAPKEKPRRKKRVADELVNVDFGDDDDTSELNVDRLVQESLRAMDEETDVPKRKGKNKKQRKVTKSASQATKAKAKPETNTSTDDNETTITQIAKEEFVTDDERANGIFLTMPSAQQYKNVTCLDPTVPRIDTNETTLRLNKTLSDVLKPHQVRGVRFVWNHLSQPPRGRGCVLADYMGLGKTLQMISVLHTFLSAPLNAVYPNDPNPLPHGCKRTALILAPASVVRNWKSEMHKWFPVGTAHGDHALKLLNPLAINSKTAPTLKSRVELLKEWHKKGGVLILGYEMFRSLALPTEENRIANQARDLITVSPGPSMMVVDEGHRLRSTKSRIVHAVNRVATQRRVVLTGYPLQNHLSEYWCMVNFARPNYLGTSETFKLRFDNPITNGQARDCSRADARLAQLQTIVLNEKLKPLVLRRDASHLAKSLPPKLEWVLHCRMSSLQSQLYRAFVRSKITASEEDGSRVQRKGGILEAYHRSLCIVNHPYMILMCLKQAKKKMQQESGDRSSNSRRGKSKGSILDDDGNADVDNDSDSLFDELERDQDVSGLAGYGSDQDSSSKHQDGNESDDGVEFVGTFKSEAPVKGFEWLEPLASLFPAHASIKDSGKMVVLFSILNHARESGDKVIVFSQSVVTLNIIRKEIELHNARVRDASNTSNSSMFGYNPNKVCGYLHLYGSTPQIQRQSIVNKFNNAPIDELAVFLASTRAAGEGLNLQSANKVVMYDMCWNPCLDHEAMCRSYRFGQTKPVSVYRLVGAGTMEEKIYDQQVRKEAVTHKVVDRRSLGQTSAMAELKDFFNIQRFKQVHKKPKHGSQSGGGGAIDLEDGNTPEIQDDNNYNDAEQGSELKRSSTEEEKASRALVRDPVLRDVLQETGQFVLKHALEDLLIDESLAKSLEEIEREAKVFERHQQLDKELSAKGFAGASLDAAKYTQLEKEFPGMGFGELASRNGSSSVLYQSSSTPNNSQVSQAPAPPPRVAIVPHIFQGCRFFVLKRGMSEDELLFLNLAVKQRGGFLFLELKREYGITHVISNWTSDKLAIWLQRKRRDGWPFQPFFVTPFWVEACCTYCRMLPPIDTYLLPMQGSPLLHAIQERQKAVVAIEDHLPPAPKQTISQDEPVVLDLDNDEVGASHKSVHNSAPKPVEMATSRDVVVAQHAAQLSNPRPFQQSGTAFGSQEGVVSVSNTQIRPLVSQNNIPQLQGSRRAPQGNAEQQSLLTHPETSASSEIIIGSPARVPSTPTSKSNAQSSSANLVTPNKENRTQEETTGTESVLDVSSPDVRGRNIEVVGGASKQSPECVDAPNVSTVQNLASPSTEPRNYSS